MPASNPVVDKGRGGTLLCPTTGGGKPTAFDGGMVGNGILLMSTPGGGIGGRGIPAIGTALVEQISPTELLAASSS